MPVLVLFGIFSFYGIIKLTEDNHKSNRTYSKNDTEKMLVSMIGKSKKECRKIARRHGGK